jgi:hypothetical protein
MGIPETIGYYPGYQGLEKVSNHMHRWKKSCKASVNIRLTHVYSHNSLICKDSLKVEIILTRTTH